ncbi:carboxymuconolactone decarboxylase family protein [Myxococcus sp. MISCRS1]|uniref:carboxymuconolactone decarboxylase family protein n=1 Tax=unclassified Myxococcus TaxID=2648731 RepID=UPI001CBBB9A2|nr:MULTISPECIES: carboxymuconolactone decarboxylase family protein [unclassified Myxococcus]MBZ4395074.1 carboxymuconolactone decarboxylase family protein [Myxococcus sp. AS-1-15]MCY1002057.1 carboxymuconolactone decarboxylase family protein [Myxococcus sp. MISCRS1]BDT36369.1 carboxymuconolactone decarboxylase family protein [Myxococcus sp. MH1]
MQTPRNDTSHPRPRLDIARLAPAPYRAFLAVDAALREGPLAPSIRELVKIRASQHNGCVLCVDMHVREARHLGESDERLHQVVVWRESLLFTDAERAALAYTEAATRLGPEGVPDAVWDAARAAFDEASLAALVAQVALINALNRIAVPLRTPPGAVTHAR